MGGERGARALGETVVAVAACEIGAALRLLGFATDLAVRVPADLAARAGLLVRRLGGAPSDGAPPDLSGEANRALLRRLYRAALQADLATARTLCAEDATWHLPGPEPGTGRYRGLAEAVPALGAIWRRVGHVEAVELRDVVASAERAAALIRLSVVRSDGRATLDWWLIFRLDGGQVTEAWGPFSTEPRR